MLHPLRRIFATPARQAYGWAALGILGVALAAVGVLLMSSSSVSPLLLSTATPTGTAPVASTTTPAPTSSPTP